MNKYVINRLKPKADYLDKILNNKCLVTITQIAKDYGMSGKALNDLLHIYSLAYTPVNSNSLEVGSYPVSVSYSFFCSSLACSSFKNTLLRPWLVSNFNIIFSSLWWLNRFTRISAL